MRMLVCVYVYNAACKYVCFVYLCMLCVYNLNKYLSRFIVQNISNYELKYDIVPDLYNGQNNRAKIYRLLKPIFPLVLQP